MEIQGGVRLANTSGNLVYSVSNDNNTKSNDNNTNEVHEFEVFDVGEQQIDKEWVHAHITLKSAKPSLEKKTISVSNPVLNLLLLQTYFLFFGEKKNGLSISLKEKKRQWTLGPIAATCL